MDSQVDHRQQPLKESSMFNNCFNDYAGFTTIPKGKLAPKFTMPDIKFDGVETPNHHVRNFISVMPLTGIDNDIFHHILPWTFDKDIIRWYIVIDPYKVMDWEIYLEFVCQYS